MGAGWGMQAIGIASTIDVLDELKIELDGNTVYVVGPTVKYAIYHEVGTSKMEARPFARPAAKRVQANLSMMLSEYLTESLGDASEEAIVKSAALAVESEMKRIVKAKGIWDTGTLHGSIMVERAD